jgi:hypothetical protein
VRRNERICTGVALLLISLFAISRGEAVWIIGGAAIFCVAVEYF